MMQLLQLAAGCVSHKASPASLAARLPQINPDRPHNKLPYRGAWLWIGPEMIHLMVSAVPLAHFFFFPTAIKCLPQLP